MLNYKVAYVLSLCKLGLDHEINKGTKNCNRHIMNDIKTLTDFLIRFRNDRHWAQFHNSKDLAIALSIEAAELNEIFLWKKVEEVGAERRSRYSGTEEVEKAKGKATKYDQL